MTERKIPLGITEDDVALGSHLVHFWQTDEEFESGVAFSNSESITNPSIASFSGTMKRTSTYWRFYERLVMTLIVCSRNGDLSFCAVSLPHR